MNRWKFTMRFLAFGALLSYFGYKGLARMCFPCAVPILPTFPIIELLGWDSAVTFYHSGQPEDHFGIYKIVLIATVEWGTLGWCIDLIRHRIKSGK